MKECNNVALNNLLNLNPVNENDVEENVENIDIVDSLPELEKDSIEFRGRIEDYKFIKEIGKGSYAAVKSALHKPTKRKYAIKIYERYKLMDPSKKTAVKREIQILKKLNHKNIVRLKEVIDNPKQVKYI